MRPSGEGNPDRHLVSSRLAEMKAPTARKIEGGTDNHAACQFDSTLSGFKIRGTDHRKRSHRRLPRIALDTGVYACRDDRVIVRPIAYEAPVERLLEEPPRL